MQENKRILTLGEPLGLWIARSPGKLRDVREFTLQAAGAELNVAIGLSRLGHAVRYLSRVGDDVIGQFLIARLQSEGVDCSCIAIDPDHCTGAMMKSLAEDGKDPSISYLRKHSAASCLTPQDLDDVAMQGVHHLHLTGIAPALSPGCRALVLDAAHRTRQQGGSISFDPNIRPSLWPSHQAMVEVLHAVARTSDWILPGLEEGRLLTGCHAPEEIADFYLAMGAKLVVIKLGPAGAYYATPARTGRVPGIPVDHVVDTVGAGDGFATGLISGLLEGLAVEDAVMRANRIGALMVQFPGDNDGLPTRQALCQ